MKTYTPPKNSVLLWQIRISVMLTSTAFVLFYATRVFSLGFQMLLLIEGVLCLVGIVLVFAYIPTYFKRYAISICDNAFIIKSGVFLTHERIMPEPRMIYAERYYTPLSKVLGLSGIILRASRAATFCAELSDKDINEILKEMSR